MADQRDAKTWVILELTKTGEQKAEEGTLEASLRRILSLSKETDVFVPSSTYSKGGRTVTIHLMEGYAFISSGLNETTYFKGEQTPDIKRVMSSASPSGMRVIHTLSDREVSKMRDQLRSLVIGDVEIGSMVAVTDGMYKGLDGRVLDLERDYAILRIEMRSLAVITKIPQIFLEVGGPDAG
jgi:transcription antitermination factor NusG